MFEMKVMIIMPGYFPGKKYGGPPVSISNFCSLMSNYECYIITHNHDMGENAQYPTVTPGWNVVGNARVMYLSDKDFRKKVLEEIVKSISPDVVYLQSLFDFRTVLPGLVIAKQQDIPVVLAPRGELCKGAFNKKYKKIPYILLLRILGLTRNLFIQSTSDEETIQTSHYMRVPKDRIEQLPNIPSVPSVGIEHKDKESGHARVLFISRIVKKKNLHSAIGFLMNVKGKVEFNIYGPQESIEYWRECEQLIRNTPTNINANYRGVVSHDEVASIFASHDAFLFPTYSENYGHVIAESLLNGCTPIISDQTPWNDIGEFNAGWAICLDNADKFVQAIEEVVSWDDSTMSLRRDNIKQYVDHKMNLAELRRMYNQFMCKVTSR